MERTLKIFLSCSFGAAIGTIVALGVSHYFWWLGLIVGGLTGYLSYEFKKVAEATVEGYKRVIGWKIDKEGKEEWKTIGLLAIVAIQLIITMFYPFMFLFSVLLDSGIIKAFWWSNVATVILSILLFVIIIVNIAISEEKESFDFKEIREGWIDLSKKINFFTVYFYWLPRGIFLITIMSIKKIPKIILFLARFVKTVFLLIHSDIRLLCGMDAAIGAGIGYFTASVIVGTFAGGILGAIQYEIVSKRILRLNAKTT